MKRNLVYAIAALTIIIGCTYLGYEAYRIYHLAEAGAILSQTTDKFEREIDGKNDILILGDSLAYGVGASSPELSFAGQLAQKYEGLSITNNAEIGETITSLKNTVDSKLGGRYKKIFIIVGGNDITRIHFNINNSASSLDSVIRKSSEHADKVFLITTGNFDNVSLKPWILSSIFNARANTIRRSAIKLEDKYTNYDYVDFYSDSIDKKEYKKLEAKDSYHLNDQGVDRLVQTALEPDF